MSSYIYERYIYTSQAYYIMIVKVALDSDEANRLVLHHGNIVIPSAS